MTIQSSTTGGADTPRDCRFRCCEKPSRDYLTRGLPMLLLVVVIISACVIRERHNRAKYDAVIGIWKLGGYTGGPGDSAYDLPKSEVDWVMVTRRSWFETFLSGPRCDGIVFVRESRIRDEDLATLASFVQSLDCVRSVTFCGSRLSDAAMKEFQRSVPNCRVIVRD
jgi:hypothetical protein